MSAQRGALWWAAHHRAHHQYADTEQDLHSPLQRGFWWSHLGWFTCDASFKTQYHRIKKLAQFPELVWLNRYDSFAPFLLIARSEEHTSELQSRPHLVCRLLLE